MPNIRGPRCCDNGITGYGNPDDGVMLIGISPGRDETRTGLPMTGQGGTLTNEILKACGWHRDKVYATNMVCYETRTPTLADIVQCRSRLEQEVAQFKPKLCVLLGNHVTESFFPTRRPGTIRGAIEWYKPWQVYMLPTYHPAALLYEPNELIMRNIVRDFMKIPDFFNKPVNPDVTFKIVGSPLELQQILDRWPRDRRISIDLEWPMKEEDSTSVIEDEIRYGSISDGTSTYWFPGEYITGEQRVSLPTDLQWGGHNFDSDSLIIYRYTGVLLPLCWDSMYASYALDERGGQHGLKHLAREYEGAGYYEEYANKLATRRQKGWTDAQLAAAKWNEKLANLSWGQQYNAKDAAYAPRLMSRFESRLASDNTRGVYDFVMKAAHVYRQMQLRGIYLNKDRFKELAREWIPQLEVKNKALQEQVAKLGGDPDINVGSPDQVGKFLFDVLQLPALKHSGKTGKPSTDAETLEALEDVCDWVVGLQDLRHLEKAVNTYLVGVYDYLKADNRLHPWPKLHAQVSGRVAYDNPAVNTTPKGYNENGYLQRLRGLYTAPDNDHVIIEIDLKQAEVWMAWVYSQDSTMLADLQSGDFHRKSAAFIFGVDYASVAELKKLISEEQRSDAKRITFGKFFLIGADKLARQSNREKRRDCYRQGVPFTNPMSRANASAFIRSWDQRFPLYGAYVDDMYRMAQEQGELVAISTGRKRRFPIVLDDAIKTQCANWPIQTTAHDVLVSAIIKAHPVCEAMGAHILLDVHDAMLIEAKKSNALDVAKRVYDIVTGPHFDNVPALPAEVKIGYSWLEGEEVHIA